ncbi:DUF4148 domain-containing protein [Rugamonas sp. DEMB1]|uniref:DUF4148 domain-containing protein n=1 Tax=Rugamonas sp. DEMB1 TaxID=3039386 RepID=UPI002447187C|nr:DUF4148 domain-containing protein [Rugamonas sp. DEMB1]WGG49188.1 DUF4148 domain-containing protein [Rugamonas sp. DEMB1]
MNSKHLIAALVTLAAAGSVFAQSAPAGDKAASDTKAVSGNQVEYPKAAASGVTRAQVIAELLEARKNGTIPETEADYDVAQTKKHFAK